MSKHTDKRPVAPTDSQTMGPLSRACPGVTAWAVARMRAKHQIVDGGDIFADPFALRVLDSDGREMIGEPDSRQAMQYRAFMAARSRVADDCLTAARQRGVRQVVLLGAGLDTTGLRHMCGESGARVFEVDKPAMQDWKKSHLNRIGLTVPDTVTYVPVDFENEALAEELAKAGLNPSAPAFFIWLGVVPYLTLHAISEMLAFAATHPAAGIVFDYAEPPENLPDGAREAFEQRRRVVAQAGEPWITYFDPASLRELLHKSGFTTVHDHSRLDLFSRYPSPRFDAAPPASRSGAHVVHATCA